MYILFLALNFIYCICFENIPLLNVYEIANFLSWFFNDVYLFANYILNYSKAILYTIRIKTLLSTGFNCIIDNINLILHKIRKFNIYFIITYNNIFKFKIKNIKLNSIKNSTEKELILLFWWHWKEVLSRAKMKSFFNPFSSLEGTTSYIYLIYCFGMKFFKSNFHYLSLFRLE